MNKYGGGFSDAINSYKSNVPQFEKPTAVKPGGLAKNQIVRSAYNTPVENNILSQMKVLQEQK